MISQLQHFIDSTFSKIDPRKSLLFCQMVNGLIKERTVNLAKIAMHCSYKSSAVEACYRRLQRGIDNFPLDQSQIAELIMSHMPGQIFLALDRTNWKLGSFEINILTLAAVYKGSSFPLFWNLLDHKGNSSLEDRTELLDQFIELFGKDCVAGLLADREFAGFDWLRELDFRGITFHIRVKNNVKIGRYGSELVGPKHEFGSLAPNEKIILPGLRKIGSGKNQISCFVSAAKSKDNDLVVILSNKNNEVAMDNYALRWGIETMFGHLKTRGYNLESTRLKDKDNISNLMILLAFAVFWTFKIGEWVNEFVPIKFNKKGVLRTSIFRYGLNLLIKAKNAFKKLLVSILTPGHHPPPPKKLLITVGYITSETFVME